MIDRLLSQYSLKKKINLITVFFTIPLFIVILIALTLFRARLYDSLDLNNKKSRKNVANAINFLKRQTLGSARMIAGISAVKKSHLLQRN